MTARTLRAALASLVLIAGCSSGTLREQQSGEASVGRIGGLLRETIQQRRQGPEPLTITRAEIAAAGVTGPFLIARRETGEGAGLIAAASNRGRIIWQAPDGITLTGRGGVLFATRGLGGDLLSAEVDPVVGALAAERSARYRRTLRRIGDDDRILRQPYDCVLQRGPARTVTVLGRAHATVLSRESCRPVALPADPFAQRQTVPEPFVNEYYVGDGTIWLSRQYVGPAIGSLRLERVIE